MNKLFAFGAMALSLALGAPALAQMDHRDAMQGSTTVTRTVDQPDGSRTVVRRTTTEAGDRTVVRRSMNDEGQRTVVRRTVVRHEVGNPGNTGWHRHHRHCVTRWHHHQRVTRCWSR